MVLKRGNKSGQITIFIIIAVLVVAGLALFFILKGNIKKQETYSPEIAPIVNFVEECIEETGEEGIKYLALHGGYYEIPKPYKNFFPNNLPYYFYQNKSLIPSKKILETEFSKYINNNLHDCIKNFEVFEKQGYKIKQGKIIAKSAFSSNKLLINLNYPLAIQKGDFNGIINNFNKEIYTTFYNKYLLVEKIIQEQEKDSSSIPIGFISELAYENEFTFDTINLNNDVVYILGFSEDDGKEFIYSFAIKYEWAKLE